MKTKRHDTGIGSSVATVNRASGMVSANPAVPVVPSDGNLSPSTEPERFVDAHTAAAFLCLRPRRILELARKGAIPAHPLGEGRRKVWRFRLSELAAALCSREVNYLRQSPAPKEIEHGAW
jgi:hypothetical protein